MCECGVLLQARARGSQGSRGASGRHSSKNSRISAGGPQLKMGGMGEGREMSGGFREVGFGSWGLRVRECNHD